jgi:SpoVK/Ycf46/Vps4 family AAA+-type ATPase
MNDSMALDVPKCMPSTAVFKDLLSQASIYWDNGMTLNQQHEIYGSIVNFSLCANTLYTLKKLISNPNTLSKDLKTFCDEANNCSLDSALKKVLSIVKFLQDKFKQQRVESLGGGDESDKKKKLNCDEVQSLIADFSSDPMMWFAKLIGMEKQKMEMKNSFVYPLVYPNLYPSLSKGLLLYGPPGTGKTMLVKAAVNELKSLDSNLNVIFFAPTGGNLKGKYVGETEQKIQKLFECAQSIACQDEFPEGVQVANQSKYRRTLAVIFLDEVEAVAGDRSNDVSGTMTSSVNALLQAMDGVASYPNVTVVAATNYPWKLDSAFLRRFDNSVLVSLPTQSDIYKLMSKLMSDYVDIENSKSIQFLCGDCTLLPNVSENAKTCIEDMINNKKRKSKACQSNLPGMSAKVAVKKVASTNFFLWQQEPYVKYFGIRTDEAVKNLVKLSGVLASKKFSNSDINRLFKQVAKQAAEEAIQNGVFFEYIMNKPLPSQCKETDSVIYLSTLSLPMGQPFPSGIKLKSLFQPQFLGVNLNGKQYNHFHVNPPVNIPMSDPLIDNIFIHQLGPNSFELLIEIKVKVVHGHDQSEDVYSLFAVWTLGDMDAFKGWWQKFSSATGVDMFSKKLQDMGGLMAFILQISTQTVTDSYLETGAFSDSPISWFVVKDAPNSLSGITPSFQVGGFDFGKVVERFATLKQGKLVNADNTDPAEVVDSIFQISKMRSSKPFNFSITLNPKFANRDISDEDMSFFEKIRNWNITNKHWEIATTIIKSTAVDDQVKQLERYSQNPDAVLEEERKKKEGK